MTPQGEQPKQGSLPRVARLGDALADQIAAGEVVERPASVVKELVDNAIDAGATRIDVQLTAAGTESIAVIDDGHGIHPDDLELSLTRHATSKLRRAADLLDIETLGFRGEALASVAAVARVVVRSRRRGEPMGRVVTSRPGGVLSVEPGGMAVGTRLEVHKLFDNVPARRKFLRSEATELGHVTDVVVRLALVHPKIRFTLTHGRRTLVELAPATASERVVAVLARRGGAAPHRHVQAEVDGIGVQAWLMPPSSPTRRSSSAMVVVRRRVVKEPYIAKIVAALAPQAHAAAPVACVWVEPPPGTVDVNVHPQKAEVRFAQPQRVYAAVRDALRPLAVDEVEPNPASTEVDMPGTVPRPSLADALGRWSAPPSPPVGNQRGAASLYAGRASYGERPDHGGGRGSAYRLTTRAASDGYAHARDTLRGEAQQLADALARARTMEHGPDAAAENPTEVAAAAEAETSDAEYLGCLPGPVGLFRSGDDLLAVELRALRSHLVYRRLQEDLGGSGIGAQALLQPTVVSVSAADVALVEARAEALGSLGLVVEPFGEQAVVVRAVPAQLSRCVDELDVTDLLHRVLPWLRVCPDGDADDDTTRDAAHEAMRVVAAARGPDPAPRLARSWIRELVVAGVELDTVPGITRWRAQDLVGRNRR